MNRFEKAFKHLNLAKVELTNAQHALMASITKEEQETDDKLIMIHNESNRIFDHINGLISLCDLINHNIGTNHL